VGKVVPVLVISPLILYSSMLMGVVLQQGNLVVVVLRVLLEGQQWSGEQLRNRSTDMCLMRPCGRLIWFRGREGRDSGWLIGLPTICAVRFF